ncbi:MAG: hypothetical protein HQK64_06635 [Desulfamplus sp.]|nr:hypothetical protein [Desulfamplus sp.]MBF0389032.1 hypothetical protein [Desulfamplus sp.]
MKIRNNKYLCYFLIKLAVASIVLIGATLFSTSILSVQANNLFSNSAKNLPVAAIISREIRPFIEMVEGLEANLDLPVVRIFMDQDSNPFSHDPLYNGTQIERYSFVVAVGPSALSYILKNSGLDNHSNIASQNPELTKKILYAMVLNPETIIPNGINICGVSLNLFSEESFAKLTQIFPSVKRVGVLFDPENNSSWFESAKKRGVFSHITTVPLHINEQADLKSLNQQEGSEVDALLFIPDKTVTSPTIISHIIKQSIAKKIPVIGYNSFFHKSGAALSFILDYKKIGEQVAQKIMAIYQEDSYFVNRALKDKISNTQICDPSTPAYYITLNRSVVELLGLKLGSSLPLELKVEP